MLSVLTRVMDISGKTHLEDVWPGIEVFFHGGVSFTPYREQYRQLITQPGMHYMETYNASEGFFGLQTDLQDRAMLLMIDYGIFYEFIPMNEVGSAHPTVLPLESVETGKKLRDGNHDLGRIMALSDRGYGTFHLVIPS